MKLWLLRPRPENQRPERDPWTPWYDKAFGFVVYAETSAKARQIANDNGGDEVGPARSAPHSPDYHIGGDPWLDTRCSTCKCLAVVGDETAGVVMQDYHAA